MAVANGYATPQPPLPSWAAGQWISQSAINALPAHVLALYQQTQGGWRTQKPLCRVVGAMVNVVSGIDSVIPWLAVGDDTDNMLTGNTNQLTVSTPGWYRMVMQVHWDTTVPGRRACKIMVNGTSPVVNAWASDARDLGTSGEGTITSCEAFAFLTAGSTIYGNAWQSSGSTLTLVSTYSGTFLSAEWICQG